MTKNYTFLLNLAKGEMDLSTDQLAVALTDTDPTVNVDEYADITSPVDASYFSGGTPFYVTTTSLTQTTGTTKLVVQPLTLTSTGAGLVPDFRYVVVYDQTSGHVIGYEDLGEEVSLNGALGDTLIINFDTTNGVLQLA